MWHKRHLGHCQIGIVHHQSVSFCTCLDWPKQRFSSANCVGKSRRFAALSSFLFRAFVPFIVGSCCFIRVSLHHNLSPHGPEASRFGFLCRVPHLQISVGAFLEHTWHQPASVSFAPKDLHGLAQQKSACIGCMFS